MRACVLRTLMVLLQIIAILSQTNKTTVASIASGCSTKVPHSQYGDGDLSLGGEGWLFYWIYGPVPEPWAQVSFASPKLVTKYAIGFKESESPISSVKILYTLDG